ncbi:MAG: hypothetical protein L6Q98_04310 [Anaerolineae bacterium]|nr:hypothetical protein [Anaerolineae bacterium]NUQ03798.1 hypothetical protein [Anaerolineae bacterium]
MILQRPRLTLTVFVLMLTSISLFAANASPVLVPALVTEGLEVVESVGVFGQPIQAVHGRLRNVSSETAYTDISLRAEIYDADEALIGEGFGVPVDACGAGWLPSYSLAPEGSAHFQIALEVFETDARIRHVDVFVTALATEPQAAVALPEGFTRLSDQPVIEVEWLDESRLRYGTGCERHPFTTWEWMETGMELSAPVPVEHPRAAAVTSELLERLGAGEPAEEEHAFVRFAPDGERLVFQNDINDLLTAAADGRFQRVVQRALHNRTLQGVHWQPEGRFLAYYFGGYGDPVVYFTATAEAQPISAAPANNRPSQIVPGISRDANRAVIAGIFGEGEGYYITVFNNGFFEKLFDATPPGNNYPAPLLVTDPATELVSRIYLALDDETGAARLMCFNRDDDTLHDLAPLPLELAEEERAAWWFSPDERKIALAATGLHSGLWLIDLDVLPDCAT